MDTYMIVEEPTPQGTRYLVVKVFDGGGSAPRVIADCGVGTYGNAYSAEILAALNGS